MLTEPGLDNALELLNARAQTLREWAETLRPETGERGRFRWARQSTRDANVAASGYMMLGLRNLGALDLLTAADRAEGTAWVEAMHLGQQQYRDPAILDRRPDNWPADRPFPDPALLQTINQYAQQTLRYLGSGQKLPLPDPPPGIPQRHESERALDYIRSLPWDTNPWGAGSHAMRMATCLLNWYLQGEAELRPLVEALRWLYAQQSAETGLWGAAETSLHLRINGTFKLFPLLCETLRLPLPHAERIIDTVLEEFARPDYEVGLGACSEWDNWYVLGIAGRYSQHRREDVRAMAIHRLQRLTIFETADGGYSYCPGACITAWCGVDMAPAMAQGDCMGLAILGHAIAVCVEVLELAEQTPWRPDYAIAFLDPVAPALTDQLRGKLGL
ncbi:MAG: hypothetical protein HUU35_03810 [Armatimonadetes bacterium]|nr:hypothetical protein [Armatimonadota bacterium]